MFQTAANQVVGAPLEIATEPGSDTEYDHSSAMPAVGEEFMGDASVL